MTDGAAPTSNAVRPAECPGCGYSLAGLGEQGQCPECGFAFDADTVILRGISRGLSTIRPGRAVMWIVAGLGMMFGPQIVIGAMLFGAAGVGVGLGIAGAWISLVVYLIATGKRERRGMEPFVFSTRGFGPFHGDQAERGAGLIRWSSVSAATIQRRGPRWYQLRIGHRSAPGARLHNVRFDAGLRIDDDEARWFADVLRNRLGPENVAGP